ncbi:MAG: trigger factor [Myxococcota bacterium]
MESTVNEISPILVEVKVQVPWDRVRKDLDESYKKIAKTARVRGFRPGKVPRNVVKQLFGPQVKAEVSGSLVEQGLLHAVETHEIQVVARPEVDPGALTDGESFEFTARMEVRPKLGAVTTEGLEVWHETPKIADEAVDAELTKLQREHSDLREPDPMRPAKAGDQLTIGYAVTIDGEAKDALGAESREVDLGDDQLLEELEQGLLGTQPGEDVSVEVPFPEDHPNPELQGKTAVFAITVKELRERLLPDIDDELAKDVSDDHETLADLKTAIHDKLLATAEKSSKRELQQKLIDGLIDLNAFPVPPSMVQEQQQAMQYEMAMFMQMAGQGGLDPRLLGDMSERAERRVRAGLLLGAMARLEGVEIDEEQIEAKLQAIAEETGKHIAKVKVEYQGERRSQLENELLEEKLVTLLRERATIHDAPPPAVEAEDGPSDAGEDAGDEAKDDA